MSRLVSSISVFNIVFRDRLMFRLFNIAFLTLLLVLFLLFATASFNLYNYFNRTASSVTFFAFLDKKNPAVAAQKTLSNWPEVAKVRHIKPDEGIGILKNTLGKESAILGTLDSNPLPDTLEITLRPDFTDAKSLDRFREKLKDYHQFGWFDSTDRYVSSVLQLKRFMLAAFIMGSALLVLITFLSLFIANRMLMHKYRNSISTLKLLGASGSFLAIPFIVDGFIEALISSVLAAAVCHHSTAFLIKNFSVIGVGFSQIPIEYYFPFSVIIALVGALSGLHFRRVPEA